MTPAYTQSEAPAYEIAAWRQSLDDVDRAIDAAYWTLAALSEHASRSHHPDVLANVTRDISTLVRYWERVAADIDEITTYERIHDLVNRLEALGMYVEMGREGGEE